MNPIFAELIAAFFIAGTAIVLSLWLLKRRESEFSEMVLASPQVWFSVLLFIFLSGLTFLILNVFAVIFISIAAMICIMTATRSWSSRKQAMMEVLSISVEKHIPLPALATAYARDQDGVFGHRVRHWAELLRAGTPLAVAVEHSRGVLPKEAVLGARIGQVAGDLAAGLRAAQFKRIIEEPMWQAAVGRLLYLGWLTLALLPAVAAFLTVKIAPSFVKIFRDFKVQLPWISRQFIGFFASDTLGVALILLTLVGWSLMVILTLHYIGALPDNFPGLAQLSRRLDTAVVLRALALSAERKRPLGPMLQALAESYPKRLTRAKLGRAETDVRGGRPWFESLKAYGLVSPADAGLLGAAERVGNLPWALNEIADSNERRLSYQLTAAVQVLVPITVVAVGVVVGAFMITYFMPLVKLITSLS